MYSMIWYSCLKITFHFHFASKSQLHKYSQKVIVRVLNTTQCHFISKHKYIFAGPTTFASVFPYNSLYLGLRAQRCFTSLKGNLCSKIGYDPTQEHGQQNRAIKGTTPTQCEHQIGVTDQLSTQSAKSSRDASWNFLSLLSKLAKGRVVSNMVYFFSCISKDLETDHAHRYFHECLVKRFICV